MKDFNFAKMVERSIATGESVTVSYPFNGEADYEEKSPIIDVKPVSVDYSSPPPICIRDQQAKSSYGANMIKNYSDSAMHNRRVSRLFRGNRFTKTWDCLQSLDYKSELRRDLVNRMMQSREHLLSVLKIMHPNGYCDGDLFIDGILTFSLRPGSCGYWTKNSVGNNFEHCAESAKTIDIESYVVMQRGIPRSIAFNDLSRMGNLEISEEKCFAYDCKPGWSLKASFDKSKLKSHRYEMDPLRAHGFRIKCMHPYLNYDDSIHHFVCDFESPDGEVVKSPLTLWESPNGDCVFDWLHPPGISPLYNSTFGVVSKVVETEIYRE